MKTKRGFVLIELLVAIAIIGVITTLLMANFNAARERARDVRRKQDLKNIQTALRLFYNDFKKYPASATGADLGKIMACGTNPAIPIKCDWKSTWTLGATTYMTILPGDPAAAGSAYRYVYVNDDDYALKSCLENASDNDGVASDDYSWCASGLKMFSVKP